MDLKKWNEEIFGSVEFLIKLLVEEIDLKRDARGLLVEEQALQRSNFEEMWKLLKSKESFALQRSSLHWLKEGDANSACFHAYIKARGRRNMVSALRVDGSVVEGIFWVSSDVVSKYTESYK